MTLPTPALTRALTPLLALSAFSSLAAAAQVGGPPIPPPGGADAWFLGDVHVYEDSSRTQLMVVEGGLAQRAARVYGMDPAGNLTLESSQILPGTFPIAFGEDRIISRDNYEPNNLRVFDWGGSAWSTHEIVGDALNHILTYGYAAELHRQTLLVSDPLNGEVDVYDLSTLGSAVQVDRMAMPAGKLAVQMSFDGTTAAILAAVPVVAGLSAAELLTYSWAPGGGFTFESSIQLGPQFDLNRVGEIDVQGTELAVGFPDGVGSDPCGRVVILERVGAAYVSQAEIVSPGPCLVNQDTTSGFGVGVDLGSAGEVFIQGGPQDGVTQYARSVTGQWLEGPRHITDGSRGQYALARDWVVGAFRHGLQVFDTQSSLATQALVCGSSVTTAIDHEWALEYAGSFSLASGGGLFSTVYESDLLLNEGVLAPALLLVGDQRGARVLGPDATVCIGGNVQRILMDLLPGLFGPTGAQGRVSFDPNSFGVTPGQTVLFQSWARPASGGPAGATTSALAITFIP